MSALERSTTASQLFTTILILTLVLHATSVCSLKCFCNICQEDHCYTSSDRESICYKSVQRVRVNGSTYAPEYNFGCISAGEGLLAHLQCHTNSLKHEEPLFIRCCNDRDLCNDYLPDPTEADDPRWVQPNEPARPELIPSIQDLLSWVLLGQVSFVFILITLILKLLLCINSRYCSKATSNSSGSTCSLKVDLENKFINHHDMPNGASSSASTHSYSISDDLCHKMGSEPANEESYIPEDLTSGLGERMLNQRTMARAVGFGEIDHVGNGRFGRVFRGQYHGEDVAVKAFRTIDQDSWKREDTIFRSLNHENIVRFIASEVTTVENCTTEIWMFLEYCPYGSLCDYLDHHEILGPQQAVKILFSIINGLNYLHEDYAQASRLYKPSIAHRDIKSKNILMRTPESCCIADFGHALIKVDEDTLDYGKYQHLQVGTIRYMAPEILRPNHNLNYRHFATFAQADLYQYGLILWEVCHRTALDILHPAGHHKLPYDGVVPHNPELQDMIKIVCEDQYRPPSYEKWEKYPIMKRLADLMVECWRPNPKARMETLGVKKKLKEIHDQIVVPLHLQLPNYFNNNNAFRDRTKSSEATL